MFLDFSSETLLSNLLCLFIQIIIKMSTYTHIYFTLLVYHLELLVGNYK